MDYKWLPKPLARLLFSLRGGFSKPRWGNFLTMIMGVLLTQRISDLSTIAVATHRKKGHRTSLGRFISWKSLDSAAILMRLFTSVLAHILRLVGKIKERQIFIAIDSTIRERAIHLSILG